VRLAFIAATTFVALPSSWSSYWSGRQDGDVAVTVILLISWTSFTVVASGQTAKSLRATSEVVRSGGERWSAGLLLADVAAITALLSISGAAQNPFSMLYFVPITWATLIAPQLTLWVALASIVGFSSLLFLTAQTLGPHQNHPSHAHFFHHVVGMAVAFSVAGVFITYLVQRIGRVLNERRQALLALDDERQKNQLTVALGAMAAGAAHELGTPLGSIQMLAEEWPHLPLEEQSVAQRTMVTEVKRMKGILHGLRSSQLSAEQLRQEHAWRPDELQLDVQGGIGWSCQTERVTLLPKRVLAQLLRELVQNALLEVPPERVLVTLRQSDQLLEIEVKDDGPGVSTEQLTRIREPFVSFRGGTGLGLFLVQVHAQQLGGQLAIETGHGLGFVARISFPFDPVLKF